MRRAAGARCPARRSTCFPRGAEGCCPALLRPAPPGPARPLCLPGLEPCFSPHACSTHDKDREKTTPLGLNADRAAGGCASRSAAGAAAAAGPAPTAAGWPRPASGALAGRGRSPGASGTGLKVHPEAGLVSETVPVSCAGPLGTQGAPSACTPRPPARAPCTGGAAPSPAASPTACPKHSSVSQLSGCAKRFCRFSCSVCASERREDAREVPAFAPATSRPGCSA